MKYTIEKIDNKVSAKGNAYAVCTLKDKDKTLECTLFSSFPNFANLKVGDEVEGELKSKDYQGKVSFTLEVPKQASGGNFRRSGGNTEAIKEAQANKAKSIAEAQDRSAWMWAKTNASTILQNADGRFAGKSNEEIANEIIDLATKIYNGEPTEPFN